MRFDPKLKHSIARQVLGSVLFLATAGCVGQETTAYFPEHVFRVYANVPESTLERAYSKTLLSLQEPSLWQASRTQGISTYRFLLMPHSMAVVKVPRSVRLDLQPDGTSTITSREGFGKKVKTKTKTLTTEQTQAFLDLVEQSGFWNLPSIGPESGLDGQMWVIEGVKNKQYHLIERWSPEGDVRKLGHMMMRTLAKIDVGREL